MSTMTDNPNKLAPFNPSCLQAQEIAFEMLDLQGDDVFFDLGCGDGRICIKAAQTIPGLQCVGIELDPLFFGRGKEALGLEENANLVGRVDLREGNVLDPEVQNGGVLSLIQDATAIFLFILPKGIVRLKPSLEALVAKRVKEGKRIRIASYMFTLKGWEPVAVDRRTKGDCPIYLYEFGGSRTNQES